MMPKVYYLAPDFDTPSWGNGVLYNHVDILNKNGIQAAIIHNKRPFRYSWFESNTNITYLDDPSLKILEHDILVVPEVNVIDDIPQKIKCRKVLFIQNIFIILTKLDKAYNFNQLDYERCIVTMPHMKKAVELNYGVDASVIPVAIAPYFFMDEKDLNKERSKAVLLFPKNVYTKFRHLDYDILTKILKRKFADNFTKLLGIISRQDRSKWHTLELKGKTHRQVAEIMKDSSFFVCVNTHEGFNVTVPEAMAAGCIPICYDALGGTDYLQDKINAYVFNNNHIYPLIEKLFYLLDNYDDLREELSNIRKGAYETALGYTENQTEEALIKFYAKLLM
jgi:glycosyltransferase involved in cell wall biosynthesis